MGLKFALWFEETKRNIKRINDAIETISVGQISGAVGTFEHLSPKVEQYVCEKLGLKSAPISTQVLQRDRHAEFISILAIIAGTLEKITTEIRHLQKTEVLEAEEFFSKGQKGSSAMPHKRNPIICERITGMARILRANAIAGFENISLWHERDISHSSVERIIVPDSCILLNYMVSKVNSLLKNLIIYPDRMIDNLNLTRGLIFSQKVLLKIIERGATREDAYSIVQSCSMDVWNDKLKNLKSELLTSEKVKQFINEKDLNEIFNFSVVLKNVDFIFERTIYNE